MKAEREKETMSTSELESKIAQLEEQIMHLKNQAKTDQSKIEEQRHRTEKAETNLKAIQQQFMLQEKLASLGQLTAGIAHEIKNPLNFVNNFSELSLDFIQEIEEELAKLTDSSEKENILELLADVKSNLNKIKHHGSRADGIVKSMLMHSRGGSGTIEPTNLNDLIREYTNLAFHGMRANKNPINVDIRLELEENLPNISLNSEDFSRVILNLAKNAFDAMRDKIAMNDSTYKSILAVQTKDLGDKVLIVVEDNGPGVPDEIRDKLLMPFFTTKKGSEGTGLGLSITNEIVKTHGGTLDIDSALDQYTRFKITLPKQTS